MKKLWRVVKLLPSLAILASAFLLCWRWPIGPRWSLPGQHLLAIDHHREIVFTEKMLDRNSASGINQPSLSAWDLVTGQEQSASEFLASVDLKSADGVAMSDD